MDLRPLLIAGLAAGIFLLVDFAGGPLVGLGPTSAQAQARSGNQTGSRVSVGGGGGKRKHVGGTGDIGSSPTSYGGSGSSFSSREPLPDLDWPDAQFGPLHAVTADLPAFIHASPHSEVGRIGVYARSLAQA